jgi:FkbM family methyltransferase
MLIDWNRLNKYVTKNVDNVLHIGGHLGEEQSFYEKQLKANTVTWIEADQDRADAISKIIRPQDTVISAVVSDEDGKIVTFHEANNGQSSSILELGTHKQAHPEVSYISEKEVITTTVDSLLKNYVSEQYQFLNLDIQGAELMALKGMPQILKNIEYIYTEVNREKLYKDCCLINEIDDYLVDFQRVITDWTPVGWGDALYVRNAG